MELERNESKSKFLGKYDPSELPAEFHSIELDSIKHISVFIPLEYRTCWAQTESLRFAFQLRIRR